MNQKLAKKIRKEIKKRTVDLSADFRAAINKFGWVDRIKIAFKIIIGKF